MHAEMLLHQPGLATQVLVGVFKIHVTDGDDAAALPVPVTAVGVPVKARLLQPFKVQRAAHFAFLVKTNEFRKHVPLVHLNGDQSFYFSTIHGCPQILQRPRTQFRQQVQLTFVVVLHCRLGSAAP